MNFIQYVFRFLYVRNWHTGQRELSRRRLYWCIGIGVAFLLAGLLVYLAQLPVVYEQIL